MNFIKAAGFFVGALVFVLSSVYLSSLISKDIVPQTINEPARPQVSCPDDFLAYNELVQKENTLVQLIKSKTSMHAKDGDFINSKIVITKNEPANSKVACGYLYVRAGTSKGPFKSWEHLYINPNNFGGHINPEGQIGPGDGNEYSLYVFPLNKISYWKDLSDYSRDVLSTADWAALLNVSPTVEFKIGISTEDPSAFIDELSIAYKCWDPATGEENTGCKLEIAK